MGTKPHYKNTYTRMRKSLLLVITLLLVTAGCEDLLVENQNSPDRERALSTPSDIVSLVEGAAASMMFGVTDFAGVNLDAWADQNTSTNNFRSFWAFADQPRRRFNNRTTNPDLGFINGPYNGFNSAISTANTVLTLIETDGVVIEVGGQDVTAKTQANAYFIRGVSRGYLGMMYDKAYLVDIDSDLGALETSPYTDFIEAAVSDLERAKELAGQAGNFILDVVPGPSTYSSAAFTEIANSFAARFLISEARTQSEASAYTSERWQRIINYAQNGVGTTIPAFSPASVSAEWWNDQVRWTTFVVAGDFNTGADYNPPDIKLLHLLNPDYPVNYPGGDVVLPAATSDDPRVEYFKWTGSNFGFLNPTRNRSLFSNHLRVRNYHDGDAAFVPNVAVTIITRSEMQYIIAEANFWLGNKSATASALANSPFGTVPTRLEAPLAVTTLIDSVLTNLDGAAGLTAGKTLSANASDAQIVRALHTEYSVELEMMGGIGLQWYFMRRHDLLQAGTPTHLPIPGDELEVNSLEFYTFGGADFAGQDGTASGANSWTTFDSRNAADLDDSRASGKRQMYRSLNHDVGPVRTRKARTPNH